MLVQKCITVMDIKREYFSHIQKFFRIVQFIRCNVIHILS